jgi:hypothetical protein
VAHLFVDLYDRVNDKQPYFTIDEQLVNNFVGHYDLNVHHAQDKAARVVVRPGKEYRRGDHIRLLDEVKPGGTDTICIDPDIAADVDLNHVVFNNGGFADKAAAVVFVFNPNPTGGYRLRVSLYDSAVATQFPTLVLYDWEQPNKSEFDFVDLNPFHFADKAAAIRVESGPDYRVGDRVILLDAGKIGEEGRSFEPSGELIDLNSSSFADKAAGVQFDLQGV